MMNNCSVVFILKVFAVYALIQYAALYRYRIRIQSGCNSPSPQPEYHIPDHEEHGDDGNHDEEHGDNHGDKGGHDKHDDPEQEEEQEEHDDDHHDEEHVQAHSAEPAMEETRAKTAKVHFEYDRYFVDEATGLVVSATAFSGLPQHRMAEAMSTMVDAFKQKVKDDNYSEGAYIWRPRHDDERNQDQQVAVIVASKSVKLDDAKRDCIAKAVFSEQIEKSVECLKK